MEYQDWVWISHDYVVLQTLSYRNHRALAGVTVSAVIPLQTNQGLGHSVETGVALAFAVQKAVAKRRAPYDRVDTLLLGIVGNHAAFRQLRIVRQSKEQPPAVI